ncbi:putative quinol monooxygenase [Nocardia jinanensis]|uniref:Antibiotic biosynthesis monooxygenase n=1 Tax=Nocardia jinanensis TaxID=382504 RepID=A0A917VRM5_9NOCA|nr:putative quinol monooxygenase [Nocardia jinanensis]GGL10951.1 antibiotic biosynthesis monooxygenase [Nocardia jinanensis]
MSTLVLDVRFTAKPGRGEDMREVLLAMIEPTLAEPGCVGYELFFHPTDSTRAVLLEEWVDRAALMAHFETPHLKACITAMEDILAEPSQMRQFIEIA